MYKSMHATFLLILVWISAVLMVLANENEGEFEDMNLNEDGDIEETSIDTPISRVSTVEKLEKFIDPPDVIFGGAVVGLFSSESADLKEFEAFARPLDGNGYRFVLSVGKNPVLDKYGVKDGWKIYVHPPRRYLSETHNDKSKYRFGGKDIQSDNGKASLKAFMNQYYLPLASRISPIVGNERIFVEQRLPVFVVISKFDEDRDPKGATYILNRLRKIGEKYRGKMLFAIIDSEDADGTIRFPRRYFTPNDASAETTRIVGIKNDKYYYTLSSAFSVESGIKFVEDFFDNKLKPASYQEDVIDVPDDIEGLDRMEL